ncbi:MAG: hypothetical protein IKR19_07580 [Acholeplasmatales bacterium]|nr:hypothetical protein [Acholeplasmatales bacterium]
MNNNSLYYVISACDPSNNIYYISNVNPVMWTNIFLEAKRYRTSKNAEYDTLRDYDNYKQIQCNKYIKEVNILEICNGYENRRMRIL